MEFQRVASEGFGGSLVPYFWITEIINMICVIAFQLITFSSK